MAETREQLARRLRKVGMTAAGQNCSTSDAGVIIAVAAMLAELAQEAPSPEASKAARASCYVCQGPRDCHGSVCSKCKRAIAGP